MRQVTLVEVPPLLAWEVVLYVDLTLTASVITNNNPFCKHTSGADKFSKKKKKKVLAYISENLLKKKHTTLTYSRTFLQPPC